MATPKQFLCRCEDITLDECESAITKGYDCFEDLKRFLGVGTGPCQGKSCVQATMHLVARHRGIPVGDVDVMTFRPPVRPIAFATLAAPDATGTGTTTSTPTTKPTDAHGSTPQGAADATPETTDLRKEGP